MSIAISQALLVTPGRSNLLWCQQSAWVRVSGGFAEGVGEQE